MTSQPKQTKIIATLGPASISAQIIGALIDKGVNVFRINFSHGNHETHSNTIDTIRSISKQQNKIVAIMGDLQGPKIRVAKFDNGEVSLEANQEFILDCAYNGLGNNKMVGVDYKDLAKDVKAGDQLLLDDGKIALSVTKVALSKVYCLVTQHGVLKNNKGINKLGGGLTAPALTTKDIADIQFASNKHLDYVAVSFVRDATDIALARTLIATHGHQEKISLIAKIERTEAIANMDNIVQASDGVMVARGDLAIEVGDAFVPAIQKKLIKNARKNHKLSIVATQMLESMITSPVATRAEVSDIANAVLDGADAVMLSAETASGQYPIEAVATMARVCLEAERNVEITLDLDLAHQKFTYIDQAIAMSALFSAYHLGAKAIVALTTSGATALWLSRLNSGIPVYAITGSERAAKQMALYRDVHPMLLAQENTKEVEGLMEQATAMLLKTKTIVTGDLILFTMGDKLHQIGGSNTLKIVRC